MRLRELARHHFADKDISLWESHIRDTLNPALRLLEDLRTPKLVVTWAVPSLAAVANGDVVARIPTGFAGRIRSVSFTVTAPATTASKAAVLALRIGPNAVAGGRVGLTSANCTPKGASVAGTGITGGNTFSATDEITVVASDVTAFVEGSGVIVLSLG